MLEKKLENMDARKLKAILLLEADFNAANKIIFNMRLIPAIKQSNLISNEIIGGCRTLSVI